MKYVSVDYVIRLSKKKGEEGMIIKEDAFRLKKQKTSIDGEMTALLIYRCADCDTVIATTSANDVFDATASQIAAETQQFRCSKCEEKY